ncbi:hypothetical protein [Proteus sp. TJ1640]|uniref:hypothetical protein n=1 Tax=Proteus sp. TJ1640 TaxID=2050968 RepID=UPI0013A5A2DF|nr:hypothetical protein [Proteus sp. TJ1640]
MSRSQHSDFELNTSTITPISFSSKTDTLSGTLILSNQNNQGRDSYSPDALSLLDEYLFFES